MALRRVTGAILASLVVLTPASVAADSGSDSELVNGAAAIAAVIAITAVFATLENRRPLESTSLQWEYRPPTVESRGISGRSKNYVLSFRPYPGIEFSLTRERGTTAMLRFALGTKLHTPGALGWTPRRTGKGDRSIGHLAPSPFHR